jgi:X-Pro dipeptidyl-peptidase
VRAVLLALALVAPLVAGCLTASTPPGPAAPALSQPTFSAVKKEEKLLPMADGTMLDNWVFRPDARGQFPVIIESRPYFGNLDPPASAGGQKFSQWLASYFVPRGYVVVLHSIRGTGDSGGCYGQGGLTEQKDEAATVEAFAKMPYSNGKVAMIGKSYGGTTPWEAAVQAPPHLVTIVPIEGITDWYKYLFTHGVTIGSQTGFDATYPTEISYNLGQGVPPPSQTQLANYPTKACQDTATLQASEEGAHATGDKDAFWQERDYEAHVEAINKANVSVYLVHGFQDWNVKPDNVATIFNKLTVEKRLVFGQQDHQYPLRADWGEDLLRWFDFFLKGIDNGILQTPPVMLSDTAGVWHDEQDFPPARAVATPLAVKFDQASYVPTPASEANDPTPGPDKLTWKSAPATAETHVSGSPTLTFNATVAGANTQFIAALYDVNGSTWTPVNWAALDARHLASDTASAPLTPGATVPVKLTLYPMDMDVKPGHAWGLVLTGAGAYWTQGDPLGATPASASPWATEAQVTVDGAALTLPVLPTFTPESPQPTMEKADKLPWTS